MDTGEAVISLEEIQMLVYGVQPLLLACAIRVLVMEITSQVTSKGWARYHSVNCHDRQYYLI